MTVAGVGRPRPALSVRRPAGPARAVVLVLHGGAENGADVVRPWFLAYLRMVPLARALFTAGARHGLEVGLLRNRVRGWNQPDLDPVRDARWALDQLRTRRPDLPVVLVGHSMGGRVAFRVADDPRVTGVCALAPWTPAGEPVEPLGGRSVLLVHGKQDRVTVPEHSFVYAGRAEPLAARLARFEVASEGHAMLARPGVWRRLVVEFTLDAAGLVDGDGPLAQAWTMPSPARLRIPV